MGDQFAVDKPDLSEYCRVRTVVMATCLCCLLVSWVSTCRHLLSMQRPHKTRLR